MGSGKAIEIVSEWDEDDHKFFFSNILDETGRYQQRSTPCMALKLSSYPHSTLFLLSSQDL